MGTREPAGRNEGATSSRILLVTEPGRDQELLFDWLTSLSQYEVASCNPEAATDQLDAFDLCITDSAGLRTIGESLHERKTTADPVFLPCLLLGSDIEYPVPDPGDGADDEHEVPLVDEVISLPVEQATLQRRIENLLKARRAAVRLKQRQDQYEQLVRLTPEAILILQDGEIVYANESARETFCPTDRAAIEGPFDRFVPIQSQDILDETLAAIEQDGRIEEFQRIALKTVTGDPIDAEVAGTTVSFGDEQAIQLLARDITEEELRKERLTLFGKAIESTIQGVTIADADQPDNPLIYANEAFEEITGYSQAEVLGRNCRFLQGEHTSDEPVRKLRTAIDRGSPVSVELLNYRKDGTPFWNKIDVLPITEEDRVTHFLGLQRDISARRAREERLQVLDRVLRHNLRNRMNVITGHADRLMQHDEDAVVTMAETIKRSASQLLSISEQIHNFGGLIDEADDSLTTFEVTALFEDLCRDMRTEYPGLSISTDSPGSLQMAAVDLFPAALREFLDLAVANNDWKTNADLVLAARQTNEQTVLTVEDRGGTIPAGDLEALATERESPLEHPEGLEIWLLRWAIANSEGELSVESEPRSTVTITLPLPAV